VSVAGREVCVEGRHEEKSEDGTRMVARQFVRRFVFVLYFITYKSSLLGMFNSEAMWRHLFRFFAVIKATSEIFSTNEMYVNRTGFQDDSVKKMVFPVLSLDATNQFSLDGNN
jgi:hypothetical protein